MKIARSLRISLRQLGAHKTRTGLALLGIVIGVSSVIVMVAVGHGARYEVVGRIEAMGTNLVMITPAQVRTGTGRQQVRGTVTTLMPSDAEAIARQVPGVRAVAPYQSRRLPVTFGGRTTTTTVLGTPPAYRQVRNLPLRAGGFHTEQEEVTAGRTAVLGSTVAEALFGSGSPIGETIRIGRVPFEVIGVVAPRGVDLAGADQDDLVIIPLRTALRRLFNLDYLAGLYLQADARDRLDAVAEASREVLRERHRLDRTGAPDDFEIQTQLELLDAHREIGDTFTMLVGALAAVSLLVGGVGILAIMLISVRERTGEIGLRLAVGARRRDVRTQFLMEASMLSMTGGLTGVVLGLLASLLLAQLTAWAIRVAPFSVAVSFGFALLVGIFFGAYPAFKAARLDPIEALRSE